MSWKLISLNIEGNRHLAERVIPFLKREQPDVVCLQEVFAVDLPLLEETLSMKGQFTPMADALSPNPHLPPRGEWGVAQFTRLPVRQRQVFYYFGQPEILPPFFLDEDPNAGNRVLSVMEVEVSAGRWLPIATTHFTWSPDGQDIPLQHQTLDRLLELLKPYRSIVLCGDMNAPRGRKIFSRLAAVYRDAIPAEYTTSLDPDLHKAGPLKLMVDGLFVTPDVIFSRVELVAGVSDHQAILATAE